MSLVYYREERKEHREAFAKTMTVKEAEIVYKKLCRHFKLREVRLEWTSGRNRPHCKSYLICLNVSNNNFGVLCHEVGHLFQFQNPKHRGKGTFHNKKHKRIMKRMIAYCEKKGWFEEELRRRLAPKAPKPKPTKEELRKKEITKLEEGIKKFESRIRRYHNLIKKKQKRINRLKRFL